MNFICTDYNVHQSQDKAHVSIICEEVKEFENI